jgi:hypothetical protein
VAHSHNPQLTALWATNPAQAAALVIGALKRVSTVEEAARTLKVARRTLYLWLEEKSELANVRKGWGHMRALIGLLLVGCSGEAFVLGAADMPDAQSVAVVVAVDPPANAPEAGLPNAGALDATSNTPSMASHPDASPEAAALEASFDAPSDALPDVSPDVSKPEAAPPPMDCGTPLSAGSSMCGPYGVNVPSSYCILVPSSAYGGTMPRQCQCAGMYTCACLLAAVADPCSGNGTMVRCADGTRLVSVTCK